LRADRSLHLARVEQPRQQIVQLLGRESPPQSPLGTPDGLDALADIGVRGFIGFGVPHISLDWRGRWLAMRAIELGNVVAPAVATLAKLDGWH
jgi:hypothetical protein